MKRFHFSLERVRQWRKLQEETESARLELLVADQKRLDREIAWVENDRDEAERMVLLSGDALQLGALDHFREFLGRKKLKLVIERQAIFDSIDRQRGRLIEARRNSRLLDDLKGKALSRWQHDFDREMEQQAAESALFRWRQRVVA